MPLERHAVLEPIEDSILETFRFPMSNGQQIIFGIVSFLALSERARRDGLPSDLAKRDLFDKYREKVERIASDEYDQGYWQAPGRVREVRVMNGQL